MKHIIRTTAAIAAAVTAMTATGREAVRLTTTDTVVQAAFDRARAMALSYAHEGEDGDAGPWFEAALPGRDAYCMRDLAHQALPGVMLGLDKHCANMTRRIAAAISETKDWCSWWETDRTGRPAACDYASDSAFWYNLPANPDMVRACRDLWVWTGDDAYAHDEDYVNFYRRSVHDYVDRWQLAPETVMSRRRPMNAPADYNPRNAFHTCRGLPSYAESFAGITVGLDLLGALAQGHRAYAELLGDAVDGKEEREWALRRAEAYEALIDSLWWDAAAGRYNTYYKADSTFHRGEGLPYMLLAEALPADREEAAADDVMGGKWNVENLSALPVVLYRLGRADAARTISDSLTVMRRNDYPEVSYGVVDGVVRGLMGVRVRGGKCIETVYGGFESDPAEAQAGETIEVRPGETATAVAEGVATASEDVATLENLPILGGTISLTHRGNVSTTLMNNTGFTITWKPRFGRGKMKKNI